MGSLFTELERHIIETSEEVCRKALESSSKELQASIKENVFKKVTASYYQEYKPSRYKRTESLYGIWGIYPEIDGMDIGFDFDADDKRMKQHKSKSKYHKRGKKWISRTKKEFTWKSNNGRPSNEWILENFFEGIHPRYILREGVVSDESYQYDDVDTRLDLYIGEYQKSEEMENILVDHLKKQCRKIKP